MQQQVQNIFRFAGNLGVVIAPDFEEKEESSDDFFVESLVIKSPPPIAEPLYFSHGVFLTKKEMQDWDDK